MREVTGERARGAEYEQGGGGWKEVRYKKRTNVRNLGGKWEGRKGKSMAGDERLSSYFITEFPDDLGPKKLFEVFKEFGLVVEVLIHSRRDKSGKRFEFVRFGEDRDERMLGVKLDNIYLSGKKILANIPKFHRREERSEVPSSIIRNSRKTYQYGEGAKQGKEKKEIGGGSRKNEPKIAKEKTLHRSRDDHGGINLKQKFADLHFKVEESEMCRFKKAFIGVVEESGMSYNIPEAFNIEGYFRVKVTPIGANLCLLEEMEEGEIVALISKANEWICQWFSEIRPWSPEVVDNERLKWLPCYGVPCHAWSFKFFDFIACSIGKIVYLDDETSK
ncbi:uncharacterized protein LOC131655034 [Vicia villosa]|uniref:uncharacterized protein LOC131655034 n=1 Tax=Vicia villosa TaxID=3911 RepID=UPI00273ACA54|nr:uncharacterized protein LOC131655034 [Vicia villosa]